MEIAKVEENAGAEQTGLVKTDTVSVLDEGFLKDLGMEVEEFNKVGARLAELTLRIGLRLLFVKENIKHGQFEKWESENVNISLRHARRCRQLAKAFVEVTEIKENNASALIDPSMADELDQMVFGFIGEDTQAELFAKYNIGVKAPIPKGGARPPSKPLTPEEESKMAEEQISDLMVGMEELLINDNRKVHLMRPDFLKALEGDLQSSINTVRDLIKQG